MIFVYPGSFDPVTNGHLDIIDRASKLCSKLIVAVGRNAEKKSAFSSEERIDMIKAAVRDYSNVEVMSFSGLFIDFLTSVGSKTIIKGIRNVADYEYEYQMAQLYKKIRPEIETLFMLTDVNYSFLSSTMVKDVAKNGGNIEGLVPDCIKKNIYEKLRG